MRQPIDSEQNLEKAPISVQKEFASGQEIKVPTAVPVDSGAPATASVEAIPVINVKGSDDFQAAGGRGLVGPDENGAMNKQGTARELKNLLKLSEHDGLKKFLPLLITEDGKDGAIYIEGKSTQNARTEGKWTIETLEQSGWESGSVDALGQRTPNEEVNFKIGKSGDGSHNMSDVKLGVFPTPHMDRANGRELRRIKWKIFHNNKAILTSADGASKGMRREIREGSQTADSVFSDVVLKNLKAPVKGSPSPFSQLEAKDKKEFINELKIKLTTLKNELDQLHETFYPAGMSCLITAQEVNGRVEPVVTLIDPDNAVYVDKENPDHGRFKEDITRHNSGEHLSGSLTQTFKNIDKAVTEYDLEKPSYYKDNPYLASTTMAIQTMIKNCEDFDPYAEQAMLEDLRNLGFL